MKSFIVFATLLSAIVMVGCQGPTAADLSCTVVQGENGSTVTCPDGSSAFIPNGKDGQSVTVSQATTAQCANGGIVVTSGQVSFPVCNGAPGTPGAPGQNGQSVTVAVEQPGVHCPTGGVKLTVGETVAYVCNGTAGATGPTGPQGPPGQ